MFQRVSESLGEFQGVSRGFQETSEAFLMAWRSQGYFMGNQGAPGYLHGISGAFQKGSCGLRGSLEIPLAFKEVSDAFQEASGVSQRVSKCSSGYQEDFGAF